MRWIASVFSLVPIVMTSRIAIAHPGHGTTDPASVAHQVVEPVHAIPWMLVIAIGVTLSGAGLMFWRNRRRRLPVVASRKPLQ